MQKVKLNLQNCYGITKLEKEFDFSSNKTYAIYAPNGVMKTSFAKTFIDFSNNVESKDLIFSDRKTVREITIENNTSLSKDSVFVIEPYNENFNSMKMSTLLVNKDLKEKYDKIHIKIDDEKERFLKELRGMSGLKDTIEDEISLVFTSETGRLFDSLGRVEKEVLDESEALYSDIKYKEIFNEKVVAFLITKDFKEKIEEYITKYDQLIVSSKYFRKGVFNHNNASVIAKSLMDNGFFTAEHSVTLKNSTGDKNEIYTKEELEKVIEEEKNTILNNPGLVKAFEELDDKLKANKELRDFRDYLLENLKVLPALKNLESFKQKIWVSYFKVHKELFSNFLKEYNLAKEELDGIDKQAKSETTQWIEVIKTFNKRFSVPFKLTVKNQSDVILKRDVPSIAFVFKDQKGEKAVEKLNLIQALSSGEKRALYILNIIFEIRARREENQETLFIIDDIADSFDYKNKYAIIEYLRDVSMETNFKQIILTHNFDFFRTIKGRFVGYGNCLMVEKTPTETKIVQAEYIDKPFNHFINNLDEDIKLIASIPFVRNLIEYTKGNEDTDYLKITSLLHIKSDSNLITKLDLQSVYANTFPSKKFSFSNGSTKITEIIFQSADKCLTSTEGTNLENKIVLSIAIRLKAEKFMFSKVSDKSESKRNQTWDLFERFKNEFKLATDQQDNISLLDQVNLMTPENIHLNSFMYEPILDMADDHLKKLYTDICALA